MNGIYWGLEVQIIQDKQQPASKFNIMNSMARNKLISGRLKTFAKVYAGWLLGKSSAVAKAFAIAAV